MAHRFLTSCAGVARQEQCRNLPEAVPESAGSTVGICRKHCRNLPEAVPESDKTLLGSGRPASAAPSKVVWQQAE